MSSSRDLAPVTVIGLGPMGRAMVTALMKAGHRVTVWNRTPSRAAELVRGGAALAPTPSDAVVASKLVILSLTDYPAMYDILSGSSGVLAGKVLVNLSSDTPAASREAAAWAAEHGARFLTGGVMGGRCRGCFRPRRWSARRACPWAASCPRRSTRSLASR